jgi:hypothetical protein
VDNLPQTATPTGPRRSAWPAVVGAILTLTVQAGWSPAEVRALAIALLVLIAVVVTAQSGLSAPLQE